MQKWIAFYNKIISPPFRQDDVYLKRASEIKDLLAALSIYPFDPVNKFRNIAKNEDLPRDEIIGAVQRHIYGNYIDSIVWSCFSVEIGLIVMLDAVLTEEEKKQVPRPFTLARIIEYAQKFGKDSPLLSGNSLCAARAILRLRNTHIHGSNFIAGIMLTYRQAAKSFENFDLEDIEQGLKLLHSMFPELKEISKRYETSDYIAAQKIIKNISTFEWCAGKKEMNELKADVSEIFKKVRKGMIEENLEQNLDYLQPDYFLRKRSVDGLRNAFVVLKSLGII